MTSDPFPAVLREQPAIISDLPFFIDDDTTVHWPDAPARPHITPRQRRIGRRRLSLDEARARIAARAERRAAEIIGVYLDSWEY